jgi:hypothetical protein
MPLKNLGTSCAGVELCATCRTHLVRTTAAQCPYLPPRRCYPLAPAADLFGREPKALRLLCCPVDCTVQLIHLNSQHSTVCWSDHFIPNSHVNIARLSKCAAASMQALMETPCAERYLACALCVQTVRQNRNKTTATGSGLGCMPLLCT